MVKKKKFVQKVRNPADVRAGIKAEQQPLTKKGQRTATKKEIETFKKTGVGAKEQQSQKEKEKTTSEQQVEQKEDVKKAEVSQTQ